MNPIIWKSVLQKSAKGDVTANVRVTEKPIKGGYAYYVSAVATEGFDADESILLIPVLENRADYVAIENHPRYFWCRPVFGELLSELPGRVQELFVKTEKGFECYLPICDSVFKTVLRGGANGAEFLMDSNSDQVTECKNQLALLCMEGEDPLTLAHEIAKVAVELLDNGLALRENKESPAMLDLLGWCSWNAFMTGVSEEKLAKKAREFKEKGVPIGFAIVDDMWGEVKGLSDYPLDNLSVLFTGMHKSKLWKFEGDPVRFPNGMKGATEAIKREGIPHVGVWFPTVGYWAGIDPDGPEAQRQKDNLTNVDRVTFYETFPSLTVAPEREKAERYFDIFCKDVKDWGCDFVKIDDQSFHSVYRNIAPIGESARAIQTAIDRATEKYFNGALINCMGMASECMFNRTSTVSRCSDDFVPESREWFAKNILQCSYNGLLQGQFYVNDWDMWWTDDEQAAKNSLCRAISGGPIYVSDELGRTNPEHFLPLCLKNGRILRPDESATPTADCIIGNPTKTGKIFKIRNRMGENGVMAVFNIDAEHRPVSGTLCVAETGIADCDCAYYEYFTGESGVLKKGEILTLTLEHNDDFRLYTFAPIKGAVTPLGRLDLYMGIGAITDWNGESLSVCEGGKLGFLSEKPIEILANGKPCATERHGKLTVVTVNADQNELTVK